jgi:hypothetical protein
MGLALLGHPPPPPVKSDQRALPYYNTLMAGERVSDTLYSVEATFADVARFLVRPYPRR